MIDPTSIQKFGADNSEVLRALRQMDGAERQHTGTVVAEAGKQQGAQRRLYEQMSLMTSAIGGQNTALGKLAFGAKALTGGFGMLGIGMLGAGTAMKVLDPLVSSIGRGLKDLLHIGTQSTDWGPFEANLKRLGAEAKSLEGRLLAAQRALMDPFGRASSVAVEAAGKAGAAEAAASFDRRKLAMERAEIEAAKARLGRAESGHEALPLELEIKLRSKLVVGLEQQARNSGLLAEATAAEYEGAKRTLAQVPLIADAKTQQTVATRALTAEVESLTAAEWERWRAMKETMKVQSEGVSSLAAIAPDKFRALGARPAGLAEIPGGLPKYGDIIRPGDESFADAMPKPESVEKLVHQISLATAAMDAFGSAATAAFAAWADGTYEASEAFESFLGMVFGGLSKELFAMGLKLAVQLNPLAIAAFVGAGIVGGFAREFGGEAAPSGGTGGYSGGAAGPKIMNNTYLIGDSFTGSSPRQNQAKMRRILGRSERTS